jgi:hypothetical protein
MRSSSSIRISRCSSVIFITFQKTTAGPIVGHHSFSCTGETYTPMSPRPRICTTLTTCQVQDVTLSGNRAACRHLCSCSAGITMSPHFGATGIFCCPRTAPLSVLSKYRNEHVTILTYPKKKHRRSDRRKRGSAGQCDLSHTLHVVHVLPAGVVFSCTKFAQSC